MSRTTKKRPELPVHDFSELKAAFHKIHSNQIEELEGLGLKWTAEKEKQIIVKYSRLCFKRMKEEFRGIVAEMAAKWMSEYIKNNPEILEKK